MTSEDFADKLAALLSGETQRCRGAPERYAALIERLAASLGFAVAMAAKGDPQMIDTLMTGAEAHAHQEAVDRAPIGKALARLG